MVKTYDLSDRTFQFARQCRALVKVVPRTAASIEDGKQLLRSSGSVAANYIEACEAISRKDFFHRLRICRKEAKESHLWLRLLEPGESLEPQRQTLEREAMELTKIFGAIVARSGRE